MSISARIFERWDAMAKGESKGESTVDAPVEESLEIESPLEIESKVDTSLGSTESASTESAEPQYDNPFSGGFRSTLWDKLNPDLIPETPEEAALRERRDRSRSTIAAISDGLAGIANMWGTVGGAENIKLSSLSDVNRQRMEKARELRDRYRDAYSRGKLQSEVMDHDEKLGAQKEAKADARYEEDKTYKRAQDLKAEVRQKDQDELTKRKVEQGIVQSDELHPGNLEKQKLELKAKEAQIRASNAAASAALAKNAGVNEGLTTKVKTYSLSDNRMVNIPDAIHDSFMADVYNYMVQQSGLDGAAFDKALMESEVGVNESSAAKMRTAVISLATKFPGTEDFMMKRAVELTMAYQRHLNPASVTQITPYGGASKSFVPTPENTTGSTGKAPTYTKNGLPYFGIDPKIKEQQNKEQTQKTAEQIQEMISKYGGTIPDLNTLTPEEHKAYEEAILNQNKNN